MDLRLLNNYRPKKSDILLAFFQALAMGFFFSILVGAVLFFRDGDSLALRILVSFVFVMPAIVAFGVLLWQTRSQSGDPFRFSRHRSRFFKINNKFDLSKISSLDGFSVVKNTPEKIVIGNSTVDIKSSVEQRTPEYYLSVLIDAEYIKSNDDLILVLSSRPFSKVSMLDWRGSNQFYLNKIVEQLNLANQEFFPFPRTSHGCAEEHESAER